MANYIDKDRFRMHIIMNQRNPLKVQLTVKEKEKFCKMLDEVSPADVRENAVAEWIHVHPLQENDDGGYMCSHCRTGGLVIEKTKFCPNCGYKMKRSE